MTFIFIEIGNIHRIIEKDRNGISSLVLRLQNGPSDSDQGGEDFSFIGRTGISAKIVISESKLEIFQS